MSRRGWRAVPRSAAPRERGGFLLPDGFPFPAGLAEAGREHGDLGFAGDGGLGGGGVREFRACFLARFSYSYREPQSTADALMRLLLTRKGAALFSAQGY